MFLILVSSFTIYRYNIWACESDGTEMGSDACAYVQHIKWLFKCGWGAGAARATRELWVGG